MNTPLQIAFRYQRAKQKNRLVSLISLFSTIGIALGVMVLIVGLSAMNGFERELHQRVLSVVPHMEIRAYSREQQQPMINESEQLLSLIEQNGNVKAVTPFVGFTALIENGSQLKIAQIRGIDADKQSKVSALNHFISESQWQDFRENGGLILGAGIAKSLEIEIGEDVTLLLPQPSEDGKLSQPLRFAIPVTGILRLDGQLDHSYALLSLEKAQELLELEEHQIQGVEIALTDPFAVMNLAFPQLAQFPQALIGENWTEKFGYMYNDIQMIRGIMYIAMVLVIGVACFNIISTLVMAVKDKQGDIAVLRTLGAGNAFIRQIFLYYGLFAGMKGAIIGIILGILVALNLTAIIKMIENAIEVKLLSDGVYFVDFLPSELHMSDVFWVLLATVILSLLASLYPAVRASQLEPAKVLSGH